ncbi:AAA family ATPase [bacterium]|nr:AAA family ATPase [bacterium]
MKAIVMVGMPGCGKSTEAAAIEGYEEINRDNLRLELTGSYEDFTREGWINREQARRIRKAAEAGRNVVISDTNTVRRYRRALIKLLKELGFHVEVQVFDVGLETCLLRNKTRSKPVDEEIIRKMANRLSLNPPAMDEGMDTIRVIGKAPRGAATSASQALERRTAPRGPAPSRP